MTITEPTTDTPYYCSDDDFFCDLYEASDGLVSCHNCDNVYEPDELEEA